MYILHCIITSLTSRSPGRFGSIMSWLLNKWHLPLIRSFGRIYDWIPQRHRRLRICEGWKGFRSLRALLFCFSFVLVPFLIVEFWIAFFWRSLLVGYIFWGSVYLFVCLVWLSVWHHVCLSLSVGLSTCLSVFLSVSFVLSTCHHVCLSLPLCLYLPVCLSTSPKPKYENIPIQYHEKINKKKERKKYINNSLSLKLPEKKDIHNRLSFKLPDLIITNGYTWTTVRN